MDVRADRPAAIQWETRPDLGAATLESLLKSDTVSDLDVLDEGQMFPLETTEEDASPAPRGRNEG